jgi:hypothetical protein
MASKIEAISRKLNFGSQRETKAVILETLQSETEIGQIAVAIGDAGVRHQEPVDRRHQAAEQGGGGHKADGSSLGHGYPSFKSAEQLRFMIWGQFMYTRCQRQPACLHGSMTRFAVQHK